MTGIPRAVEWLGLFTGWLLCLLFDRLGIVAFAPPSPGAGIPNWCTLHGYAKAADWFWYAAFPAAGLAGSMLASRLHAAAAQSGRHRELPGLPLWPAAAAITAAVALLFSGGRIGTAAAVPLSLAGVAWPWFSRRWYAPARAGCAATPPVAGPAFTPRWAVTAAVLGLAWAADPFMRARDIDLLHEGVHLLYVQSWLAGDLGAGLVRTEYGSLYTWSIVGWMSAFGMTVLSMRWYFLAAQAAGMAAALLCLRALCTTPLSLSAGAWLLLTATCTDPGGWANVLRVALPLSAVVVLFLPAAVPSRKRAGASGVLAAVSVLYSPEFGAACVAACAVAAVGRGIRNCTGTWAVAAAATAAVLWLSIHGTNSLGAAAVFAGGYPLARLGGHAAWPLPSFRWAPGDGESGSLLRTLSVWVPVLLATAALSATVARSAGRALHSHAEVAVAALASFVGLAMIPSIARPLGQQAMAAPAWVLLAAAWLDGLVRARRRGAAAVLAASMAAWGLVAPDAGAPALARRLTRPASAQTVPAPADMRTGRITLSPAQARFLGRTVRLVRRLCPPGDRILLASPAHLGLAFLADRAALPPFPQSVLAVSPADRALLIEALEYRKPPLAVVSVGALDVALPEANPELWKHVRTRYRALDSVENLLFFVRNF